MRLVARHQIFYAPRSSVMPGEVFDLPEDAAVRLIDSGAADAYADPVVVSTPPPAGKKASKAVVTDDL